MIVALGWVVYRQSTMNALSEALKTQLETR